jgi:hypothetical protein
MPHDCVTLAPQVEWIRERLTRIPVRLVFESALELMGTTQVSKAPSRIEHNRSTLRPLQ